MLPLKLNTDSMLYTCVPQVPKFTDDEVEIWLYTSNEKLCIFKDSLNYVLFIESAHVVKQLEMHNTPASACFPKMFMDYCLGISADDSYLNHLFTEYQCMTSWITKKNNGELLFEIWKIDPFSTPALCELRYSYTISYDEFMKWWNQFFSI